MRLAFSILGTEVFAVDLDTPEVEADEDVWVDCGATVSTPVGFYRPEVPWDADGPTHAFDPSEGDEDT